MVLIGRLPGDSWTMTEIRESLTPEQIEDLDGKTVGHGRWSRGELLLAAVADRIAQQTWVLGQWKTPPPMPDPIPRPGVKSTRKPQSVEELKATVDPRAWAVMEAVRNRQPIPVFDD
jgi:hypothetical protein